MHREGKCERSERGIGLGAALSEDDDENTKSSCQISKTEIRFKLFGPLTGSSPSSLFRAARESKGQDQARAGTCLSLTNTQVMAGSASTGAQLQ